MRVEEERGGALIPPIFVSIVSGIGTATRSTHGAAVIRRMPRVTGSVLMPP